MDFDCERKLELMHTQREHWIFTNEGPSQLSGSHTELTCCEAAVVTIYLFHFSMLISLSAQKAYYANFLCASIGP